MRFRSAAGQGMLVPGHEVSGMRNHRDERDIYSKPGHLIRRLQQIGTAMFVAEAGEFGVTPVQYSALLAVRNHPGIDQSTLMQIAAFDRSTIGEVVGRLVARGLLRRVAGTRDRRTKLLYLTRAGRTLTAEMKSAVDSAQRLILAPLKPVERAQFMRLMRKLVDLNNDRSRAPLRLPQLRLRARRAAPAVRPRRTRALERARS